MIKYLFLLALACLFSIMIVLCAKAQNNLYAAKVALRKYRRLDV